MEQLFVLVLGYCLQFTSAVATVAQLACAEELRILNLTLPAYQKLPGCRVDAVFELMVIIEKAQILYTYYHDCWGSGQTQCGNTCATAVFHQVTVTNNSGLYYHARTHVHSQPNK